MNVIDAMATAPAMPRSPLDARSSSALKEASFTVERVEEAQSAAEQLVATTFVLPMLEEMHKNPFAAGPFAPGAGEKRFTPMLDQQMADRIVKYGRFPLVDSLREHLLGRGITA